MPNSRHTEHSKLRRRRRTSADLVLVAALAVGCGDDESDGSDGSSGVICLQALDGEPAQCVEYMTLASCGSADVAGATVEEVSECPASAIGRCETGDSIALFYESVGTDTAKQLCELIGGTYEPLG